MFNSAVELSVWTSLRSTDLSTWRTGTCYNFTSSPINLLNQITCLSAIISASLSLTSDLAKKRRLLCSCQLLLKLIFQFSFNLQNPHHCSTPRLLGVNCNDKLSPCPWCYQCSEKIFKSKHAVKTGKSSSNGSGKPEGNSKRLNAMIGSFYVKALFPSIPVKEGLCFLTEDLLKREVSPEGRRFANT